jgi:hypothetical protein
MGDKGLEQDRIAKDWIEIEKRYTLRSGQRS